MTPFSFQAKAAKLPKIALTGSVGGTGPNLSEIANPTNAIWNVASNLMFPIFDGGNLEAQVQNASAAQKQAIAAYQKSALNAFVDIENALSNETTLQKRAKLLKTAYEEAKRAEEIGFAKYKSGEGNLLDLQQLQRATISAQSLLLSVEHDLFVQRINLYLSLGGEI